MLDNHDERVNGAGVLEAVMAQMIDQGYTPLPELMEAAADDAELHG